MRQDIALNARKNAPAQNVNFFIVFLDISKGSFTIWLFDIFFKKKLYRFLLHKIIKKSKCTSLSVSRTFRETKKINARGGVDMRHFRAKSQHLDTLPTLICLFIACFFTCGDSRQVKLLFVLWKRGNVLFDNLNDLVAKSRSNNLGIS